MAKDGLRKAGAVAVAVAGLAGVTVVGGFGAGATEPDEFAIDASEYRITDEGAAAPAPNGPDFMFIDENNNGSFETGLDTEYVPEVPASARGKKAKPEVIVDLDTAGFVIPSRVKKVDAAVVNVTTNSGRIEVGSNVSIKSEAEIYLIGGDVIVGARAKLLSQGPVDLDTSGDGTVAIGDNAKIKAGGGIEDNAPDEMHIGANVALMAPEAEIYLLDPDQVMTIGAGTKFVADYIEFGVGAGDDTPENNTFTIGEGVSFISKYGVDIDNFGTNPLVFPASVSIKGERVDLLGGHGQLTISGKVKAKNLKLRSNNFVRLDGATIGLVSGGTFYVHGTVEGRRTGFAHNDSKVNVGKGGTFKVWTNSLPVDTSKMKPADKTVVVNEESTVTVNMVNAQELQGVYLELYDPDLVDVPFTQRWVRVVECSRLQNPCVGSFARNAIVRVWVAHVGRPYVIAGECSPTTGVVQSLQVNRTCSVTFS